MKLLVNENNEIEAYSIWGDIEGAIDFTETVPDDFYEKFKPSFYLLKNNEIVENPNYVAPKPPEVKPSDLEKQVATLGYQQMVDSHTIETLQKQNAQMAYQIMTGGNA
ncbi:DUF2977 domain-containing protein [Pediococcus acidilactici]|uniref:DUF2977 domain-containing protein n=1 Tax=Pediococcus acidilactici TaxID=1254 RepID=UPI0013305C35|nr:DUF2977 domain-containing protein [Pediococcus acidilactici]KAF0500063.1 DUF2977 domain-containing protein [Pediococcus acidilactici]